MALPLVYMDTTTREHLNVPPAPTPGDGPLLPGVEGVEDAVKRIHFEKLERRRSERLPSRDCRQNEELILSVMKAVEEFGEDQLVTFTLTFPGKVPYPEATKALKRAHHILEGEFLGWMWAADLTKQGNWHFHCFGIVPFNARQGLDRSALGECRRLERLGQTTTRDETAQRRRLRKIVSSNPGLVALRGRLEKRMPACGFGWKVEVTPIWKTAECAAKYLVKGIVRVQRARQRLAAERRAIRRQETSRAIKDHSVLPRGARLFGFGGKFPRVRITEPTPGMLLHRAKLAAIQQALIKTDVEMHNQFGPRWKFRFGRVIHEIEYCYGRDLCGWDVDKIEACVCEVFPDLMVDTARAREGADDLPVWVGVQDRSVPIGDRILCSILKSPHTSPVDRRYCAAYFREREHEWLRKDSWEQWLAEPDEEEFFHEHDLECFDPCPFVAELTVVELVDEAPGAVVIHPGSPEARADAIGPD